MKLEQEEKAFLALLNVSAIVVLLSIVGACLNSLVTVALAVIIETCLLTWVIKVAIQLGISLKEIQESAGRKEDDLK